MTDNPCLRPACLSDVVLWDSKADPFREPAGIRLELLRDLYDAEWRKRGFERSP